MKTKRIDPIQIRIKAIEAKAKARRKAGLATGDPADPIWAFADDTLVDIPELDAPLPQRNPGDVRSRPEAIDVSPSRHLMEQTVEGTSPPIGNCPLKFVCSKKWENLTKTDNPRTRHCDSCDRTVHLCNSRKEYQRHLAEGACVALGKRLSTTRLLGVPERNSKLKSFLE